MSLFISFLTVAAWVGLVVGGAWLALALWATVTYEGSIEQKLHAKKEGLQQTIRRLKAELLDVMGQIKAVSRKERQVRGRIAELKLEQAGKTDLLNNPDLLKLVG